MPIHDHFAVVLERQHDFSSENTVLMKERREELLVAAKKIEHLLPKQIGPAKIRVDVGDGIGRKSRIPWIRLVAPQRSIRSGELWYLVFLFCADGSGIYLSLMQEAKDGAADGSKTRPLKEIEDRTVIARNQIRQAWTSRDGDIEQINLRAPVNAGDLPKKYEAGTAFAVFHRRDALPTDDVLLNDVHHLIGALHILTHEDVFPQNEPQVLEPPTTPEPLPPTFPPLTASDIEHLIQNLDAAGWIFEPWQVAAYFVALQTKPFVILGGVSGTGKSQLPKLVATQTGGSLHHIAVRPDWTDSAELLGYCDLEGKFRPGALSRAARTAMNNPRQQHVCLVDEMNLARVEHYMAEVLSRMEDRQRVPTGGFRSGRLLSLDLHDADRLEWEDLHLPPNLALVGTVNMDESTHGFSRKVLDRAFTIELSKVNLDRWAAERTEARSSPATWPVTHWQPRASRLSELGPLTTTEKDLISGVVETVKRMNESLSEAQLHLGYRSMDEIALFCLHAEVVRSCFRTNDGTMVDPLDLALTMKMLPRISGGSRGIRRTLAGLVDRSFGGKGSRDEKNVREHRDRWEAEGRPEAMPGARWPRTAARLALMWDRLTEEGFTSFWL